MAGRSKKMRCIQSYVNHIDNHTFSGPMKMGLPPKIGVTHRFWRTYATECNNRPDAIKKSYNNMVFLNINPAQNTVPEGFTPSHSSTYG